MPDLIAIRKKLEEVKAARESAGAAIQQAVSRAAKSDANAASAKSAASSAQTGSATRNAAKPGTSIFASGTTKPSESSRSTERAVIKNSRLPATPLKTDSETVQLPSLAQVYGAPFRDDIPAYMPSSMARGQVDPANVTRGHYAEWLSNISDEKAFEEYRQQVIKQLKPSTSYQATYNIDVDREKVKQLEYQLRFEQDPEERKRLQREIDTTLTIGGMYSPEAYAYASNYYRQQADRAEKTAQRRTEQAAKAMAAADEDRKSSDYSPVQDVAAGEQRLLEGLEEARQSGDPTVISAYERALEQYRADPGRYAGLELNENEKRAYLLSGLADEAETAKKMAWAGERQAKTNRYYLNLDKEYGFSTARSQDDFAKLSKAPAGGATYAKLVGNNILIHQPFEEDYHWDYMTDDEKATLYYLYNTQGEDAAKAYMLDYLGPGIDEIYAQDQATRIYDETQSASGWDKAAYSMASVFANAVAAPASFVGNAGQVLGNAVSDSYNTESWKPVNSYGDFSMAARNARTSRQAVADSLSPVGSFLYQTGMSMADNLVLMPTGQVGTLALMGLNAADAQYAQDIDSGVDPEKAIISGAIAGGIEILTETASIEHLFNAPDTETFLRGLAKQALFEGTEEGASDVLNLIREQALYGKTSYGNTPEEHKQWFRELLLDMAGGALSGGVMYTGFGGARYALQRGERKTAAEAYAKQTNTVSAPMDGTSEGTRAKAQSRAEGMKVSDEGASVGGEQVKVNGITQVAGENGEAKVTVTMPDGSAREVNMSDVTFARESAELYSYAADMASREVANAFRTLYTKDQDMARVATGMNAAYDMGRAGYRNIETVRKSVLTSALTDQQLTKAYELGAGARTAEQNRIVTAAAFRAKEVMGKTWRGGQVTYDNVNVEALSAEQRRNVELVAVLAGLAGKNVELFESQADENGRYTSENGSYDPKTNTIRIDVNAGRNNRRDSMAQTALIKTMSHELTHDMQKNAPKEYARVRNAVLDVLESQENVDLNDLVDAKLAINSRLSREAALDEVVADACEGMLRDSDFAQRMQQAHPEATKTLGQRLRELLGRIIDAIKAAYQGGRLSREASMLMREAERYREIADMWAEGAQKAAEVTGREQEQGSVAEAAESESEAVESVAEDAETAGEGAEAVPGQRLVGEFDEPARPTEVHIDNRTWESVAEKSVEPFQNDYRIARSYMGVAAKTLLQDANESVPGKRFMNTEGEWSGQKRMTTPVLAELMDNGGWSWDRLKSGLTKISDAFDAGDLENKLPNNVLIKRLELVLDEMLTDGYTTLDGTKINPDTGYLAYKAALPGAAKQTTPEAAAGGVDFGEYVQFSMRDDVKFSERSTEQISVREMLANVIEDASTSADEMAWLKGYRKDLKELDKKLDAIGQNKQIIRELMFKKGRTSEESQRLSKARERLKILNEQVARMDEGLLKLEGSDFIRGLVEREARKIRDREAEKRRAGIAKVRETQRNAAVRKNIRQRAKRLDRMLREPTDRDHIPEGLKSAMIDLMDIFTRSDDSAFGATAKDRERLYRAQSEYMAMQSADPESDIASRYDEDTADRLRQLGNLMNDGKLTEFGAAELAEVSKVLEHFEHLIRDQNDEFRESKRRKTEEYAREIWQQTVTMKGRKENAFTAHALVKAIKHMGQANNIPVYFYKHLGGAMGKLGNDLLKAEGRYGVNAGRAEARIEQIKEAHDYKSWAAKKGDILRLETESGDVLELTREQALGIWASAKRERTNTIQRAEHLRTGGVILEKAARKAGLKGQELNLTPTKISNNDIARIDGWLTDQQKKYADAMVNYISTDMAELGNETSMELVGYKKFGEGYYYPYKTSSDFRRTNLGNVEQALIKNMGFTKSVVRNAKTPVVITDFSETVADHVNAMLMYNAFAAPQDQLLRVYDFRLDDSTSVKNMLRSAYGDEVPGYIEQHMRDLYGGVSPDRDAGLVNTLISGHKRAAVLGSASVVIQQFWAIIRAMSEVNPKYFSGKMPGGGFEEAKKYAGTAVIKDMGGFDTSMSRGATDWINGNTKDWESHPVRSTVDKINDVAGMGAEKADQLAWSLLWKAVKKEQAEKTGLDINSEELKQRAGERFDEVVRLTQVYDSVMSKSQLMRNKNVFWKGATAFMAEPTLTMNMMVDAVMEARQGNVKKAGGIVASVLVSVIFTNLAKALVTASRDDDDEEATWLERYVKNATEGLIGDFIPLNYLPIARDVYSRLQGYDVERTDMSIINDILAAGETILNPDSSPYKRAKSGVQVLSLMTGIPAHNLWREAEAAINTATATPPSKAREGWLENALRTGLVEATPIGKWFDLNDSKARSADKLYEALMEGDAESAGEWRSHLMLYNGAEDDAAVNSLLRSRIKEGYENGELDSGKAVDMLTEHAGMKRYDAEKRVSEWSYAVDTGTNYSDLKDEYLNGNLTDEEAIAARAEYGGADEADAADTIAKWRYEKENGIAYADMKDAYIAGDLTEAQAIADMVEYGGKREADARQTVSEWNYEKESGGEWGQMKADYIAGRMTADEVVAAQVKYGGALEKDVRAQLLKWDYERDTGIAYTDMKGAYLEGGISREAAVEARVKYGGLDADAAEQEVSKWNFEADYGYSYDDMRDYYELGNISYDEAVAARVKYGGAQEDDAYFAVAGWEYEQETGDEWDGKFTKIHDAVDSGSSADMRSSIQEVYDHSAYEDGKKAASAVTSNITSTYKPIYLAATPAQRAAMEPRLLEAYRLAYELAGEVYYGDSYKLKQIRKWAED